MGVSMRVRASVEDGKRRGRERDHRGRGGVAEEKKLTSSKCRYRRCRSCDRPLWRREGGWGDWEGGEREDDGEKVGSDTTSINDGW